MTPEIRFYISLILNIIVAVMEITAVVMLQKKHGTEIFQYFTEDSNILALLSCILFIIGARLTNDVFVVPKYVQYLRYFATCGLMVTFLTVIFVLAPIEGKGGYKKLLLKGPMTFMHFLCPIISFISFVFFEDKSYLSSKAYIWALAPVLIYGTIIMVLIVKKKIVGPYPFLRLYEIGVKKTVLYGFLMLVCSLLINLGILRLAFLF